MAPSAAFDSRVCPGRNRDQPFHPRTHLSDLHTFEVFAEVGVVLLMFSIGVEFSIPDLMRVKWVALVGGPTGILLMLGVTIGAGKLAGWSMTQRFVVGAAVSVASTMVLTRLLSESGKLGETYGRVMIGITLVVELSIICITVVLPAFSGPGNGSVRRAAWTLGKALVLITSPHRGWQISGLDSARVAVPLPVQDLGFGGFGTHADRGALVRGRASGALGRDGRRKYV